MLKSYEPLYNHIILSYLTSYSEGFSVIENNINKVFDNVPFYQNYPIEVFEEEIKEVRTKVDNRIKYWNDFPEKKYLDLFELAQNSKAIILPKDIELDNMVNFKKGNNWGSNTQNYLPFCIGITDDFFIIPIQYPIKSLDCSYVNLDGDNNIVPFNFIGNKKHKNILYLDKFGGFRCTLSLRNYPIYRFKDHLINYLNYNDGIKNIPIKYITSNYHYDLTYYLRSRLKNYGVVNSNKFRYYGPVKNMGYYFGNLVNLLEYEWNQIKFPIKSKFIFPYLKQRFINNSGDVLDKKVLFYPELNEEENKDLRLKLILLSNSKGIKV
jgi:hypothetical protein